MAELTENWLEELKARVDILTVIGGYTKLVKKGRSYWGLCPFHHEKTPSFSVNAEGRYYHCFGCGVGGDVIKFVQNIESVDFLDAVKILAEKAGMKVPELVSSDELKQSKKKKDDLRQMMKLTARRYFDNLNSPAGSEALNYLRSRGVEDKYIVRFGLGASIGFNDVIDYLSKRGYSKELMLEAGIAEVKNGKYFDALHGRLIFPIFDNFGDVVAFGGRFLGKTDFAKYKNATNTTLFNKSKNLYGINLLSKVKQKVGVDSVIIVEGYMDTISLVQAGIENVVASMGTALTAQQAKKLKNYANTVYICYDGDGAGQKATLRGLDILKEAGLNVRVVSLPDGLDPDDTVKKLGKEGFNKLLKEAKPLVEYKLSIAERKLGDSIEEKTAYAHSALEVLREIQSTVEREAYLPEISKKSGLQIDSLRRELYEKRDIKEESDVSNNGTVGIDKKLTGKDAGYYTASRFILATMLAGKKYDLDGESLGSYFTDKTHLDIFNYVTLCRAENKNIVSGNLFGVVDDEELNAIIGTRLISGEEDSEKRFFKECALRLKKKYLDKRIAMLSEIIKKESDPIKKKEYLTELNELVLPTKKQ